MYILIVLDKGVLMEDIRSPFDKSCVPVPALNLGEYLEKHSCPYPRCMCNLPCRFFRVVTGQWAGNHAFACGKTSDCCGYWGQFIVSTDAWTYPHDWIFQLYRK